MKTVEDVQTWRGMKMIDADGDKIGTIENIFLDRQTGEPACAAVKTGLFGRKETLVPIHDAELTEDNEVRVALQKEKVKDAPRIDAEGELTPEEERTLWKHYVLSDYDEWQGDDRTRALALPDEDADRARRSAAETEAVERHAVDRRRPVAARRRGDDPRWRARAREERLTRQPFGPWPQDRDLGPKPSGSARIDPHR